MREAFLDRLTGFGERTALWENDVAHSFADLMARVRAVREQLDAAGVEQHDSVLLQGDFSADSIAALFALYLGRNTVVPLVNATPSAVDTVRETCGPRFTVRTGDGAAEVKPLEGGGERAAAFTRLVADDAAGLVLLSSGSTGKPKAILHNLDALVAQKLAKRPRGALSLNMLMVLMFDHIGGVNSLLSALLAGSTAVLPARRTPEEICELVQRHKIRVLPASPTFLNLILVGGHHERHDMSSLRLITYGTEPMSDELLARVNGAFPGVRLLQTFGTSETGIAATASESSSSTYFRIADDSTRYRVVDGQLELKSDTQFLGYLNHDSDAITDDGWFRTGDLVEENGDGYIRIRGRATEMINVGGEKLLPLELESILLTSPLIEDCVVYGRPNALTGQAVCVDVKPAGELSRAQARAHVREFLTGRVEPFKIPSKIAVVDAIGMSERLKKTRLRPRPDQD
ncbi:long-chain fatty acid--CoA ligase [Kutzneria kofuensis]|uniref:Acyl-coenzyme A synthetase/AMP-(Fatty) acid ligase n=1 Tax=Kutzneria kofuensis TaxID=103725 RepID=A0A7W9NEX3_9PSEU|nr:long-chain fatty acid--CoA ligase [Kutzneria kofuensis]MBB5889899.1 acyl-coenzyme A synthetase/AMP-(fatty) acid ligase [Kutzneria kofuensis]